MSGPDPDLSEDVAFFLTASAILEDAESRDRSGDARRRPLALPLEDEDEEEARGPIELISDEGIETAFREQGEEEIADVYRNDREQFWARLERGREALLRPAPPKEVSRARED